MGYGLYLNFEKVSMEVIENNIKEMTENNLFTYDEDVPDETYEKTFIKNLYHGSIAIIFIVNLFETAINTILTKRIGYTEEEKLKMNTFSKIELICLSRKKDFAIINGNNKTQIMKKAIKLRNDITHYKTNILGGGTFITSTAAIPFGKTKEPMAEEFTKQKMQEYYENTIKLLELICQTCGYRLNNNCRIIDCDGRDDEYEYILE